MLYVYTLIIVIIVITMFTLYQKWLKGGSWQQTALSPSVDAGVPFLLPSANDNPRRKDCFLFQK